MNELRDITLPDLSEVKTIVPRKVDDVRFLKFDKDKLHKLVVHALLMQKQAKERQAIIVGEKVGETATAAVTTIPTEVSSMSNIQAPEHSPVAPTNGTSAPEVATVQSEVTTAISESVPGTNGTGGTTTTPELIVEAPLPTADATADVTAPSSSESSAEPTTEVAAEASPEADKKKQFLLNSDNLAAEVESGTLKRTSTGLIDGVALFGSTHAQANWRLESTAPALAASEIFSYNPRADDWGAQWNSEVHPHAEALAMGEMSVLAMRIENKDVLDGSLGSMVEMGMAALSAALNGQRVVVSIEENIDKTLMDPGALAQFEAMREELRLAEKNSNGLITVIRNGSLENFNKAIQDAVQAQRTPETAKQPLSIDAFKEHRRLKEERFASPTAYDIFGGSSGAFTKDTDIVREFENEQERIQSVWPGMWALNKDPAKAFWDMAEKQDGLRKAAAYRLAFKAEQSMKSDARTLVWSIQNEAVSKAAITEIGFILLKALASGEQVMIVMEPFSADLYLRTVFRDKISMLTEQVSAVDKTGFTPEEITAHEQLMTEIRNSDEGHPVDDLPGRVKRDKLIGKTQLFRDFDNARRTRAVIEAQMLKMVDTLKKRNEQPNLNERIGQPFFTFATSIEEYTDQAKKIQEEYKMKFEE